jgi:RNA polymerase sigma factor (sigma-70 family)
MGDISAAAIGAVVEVPAGQDPTAGLDARFRRPLMKFFMRRVHDVLEAEDLTQEVFTRALSSGELSRVQRPDSFLFTVATNLLRDRHRSAVRRSASATEAACIAEFRDGVEDCGPERVLEGYESLQEVLRVLDELPERTRDIFILFRLENMKQKDIAALYGITQKAVEKHVLKVVTHLVRRFEAGQP